jgi:hypothetical protein
MRRQTSSNTHNLKDSRLPRIRVAPSSFGERLDSRGDSEPDPKSGFSVFVTVRAMIFGEVKGAAGCTEQTAGNTVSVESESILRAGVVPHLSTVPSSPALSLRLRSTSKCRPVRLRIRFSEGAWYVPYKNIYLRKCDQSPSF